MVNRNRSQGTVAFLGPVASYTHQAALECFPSQHYSLSPQQSIEDVFLAVQTGNVYRGLVPFENSTNGSVVFTLDLFADLQGRYPDILVCGEAYIEVHHCLLSYNTTQHDPSSPTGLGILTDPLQPPSGDQTSMSGPQSPRLSRVKAPLADLSNIKKLYSHPQAWGQCKEFLSTYLKGVERQDVSSTSKAAELVSRDPSGTSAAISSGIAARVHGLQFLAKGIEDREDNVTRFFVIKKKDETKPLRSPTVPLSPGSALPWVSASANSIPRTSTQNDEELMKKYKSLVSFTVDHEDPGALADSLAVFKRYKLNLTSINTRPSGVKPWNYIFFVELKGKRLDNDEGAVNQALADLSKVAKGWRWLGSWESKSEAR